jgi:hypothetical protein
MNYPSITIQGNILSGEIFEKIRNEEIKHQTPASFNLPKNTKLRDEISVAWNAIRGQWQTFKLRVARIRDDDSGTSETRNFWMLPFLTTLGYDTEKTIAEVLDNKTYAISHRAANLQGFPVHIMGINDSLDKRRETSGPRLSPHALVQEYLNKTDDHLYALVTNGRHLRLLRDATRLVRLAYIEFDLEKMMEEELFADFVILFRLLHATRMPQQKGEGETSIIEQYHQEALEAGTRIREKLSEAVEFAIKEMANGFLQHPTNVHLRETVDSDRLTPDEFYHLALRLVYRILFLLVIEDRGLVYPDKLAGDGIKKRNTYLDYYSINRLRQMSERKRFIEADKHDLWENLKVSFRLFENARYGEKLGIQPLGSGIFDPDAIALLEETRISNKVLLEMMHRLCYFYDDVRKTMVRVNYGDLDVEEFGSVYEGLLEYQPVFNRGNGNPVFSFEAGTGRSSSGSHYTPEELVRPLIQHSLQYIIDDCLKKPHERLQIAADQMPTRAMQEKALLGIKVCDVACGSGHILLSAARRIATELAKVRTGEDQPSPPAMRQAIRDAIRHCIYGVDKNPLAVELCKVALWLEAHNPGEPLNFLDHKIKCGDSIVGLAHREELDRGVADEAFKTLPGDDKAVATAFRNLNKKERKERGVKETQLAAEFEENTTASAKEAMEAFTGFARLPERTPEEIARKQQAYQRFLDGRGHQWLKLMADLQVAQFFVPKTAENKDYLLTDASYRQILAGYKGWQNRQSAKASVVAQEKRFFHWFVEFPEVFTEGGFDCILGNPPFLGGQKLTGSFGNDFLEYLKYQYAPIGSVDLVTYFFRRIFCIIIPKGFLSLISTNTIAQGRAREDGLDIITKQGGSINHAVKSMRWPGQAAVEVALVTITKQAWRGLYFLSGKEVKRITPYLDDAETTGNPFPLKQNEGKSFQGSIVLGKGFVLEPKEAKALIAKDPKNKEVLFPYLNGDDLNNNPDQSPSRWVINFFDWPEEKAKTYPECFKIVEQLVKPERLKMKADRGAKFWWQFLRMRNELYQIIAPLETVLVLARISKTVGFSFVEKRKVFADALVVFSQPDPGLFIELQSSIHNAWAWNYCTTMKSDLNYTPGQTFETFPFQKSLITKQEQQLKALGANYHEHRRQLMLSIQLGLTKTYNAFHAPGIQPGITTDNLLGFDRKAIEKQYGKELWNLWNHLQKTEGTCTLEEAIEGIVKLRELHVQMDETVLDAYGWGFDYTQPDDQRAQPDEARHPERSRGARRSQGVQLRHDFYEVDYLPENDRIRFTIHPDARKEVLKRLLELNHQYFEEEARQGLHKEATVRKFYEQKSTPIPEEVSKWFKKGKAYKKLKSKTSKTNEPESGYGGLFDQQVDT